MVRYFRDRDASWIGKLFVLAALAYVVSPVDAIPDAIPVIGWLDDVGVLTLLVAAMWKVVDRYRVAGGAGEPSEVEALA